MSGLNALMFALALVFWMQARITNSSTKGTLQTSTTVTNSPAAPTGVTVQVSQNVTSSPVHVASASITVQASENVTVSSPEVSASVTVQARQNATLSSPVASASVTVQASEQATSSPLASASVTVQASEKFTSSPVAPVSVTVQTSKNATSSPAALASVTLQASEIVRSSTSTFAMQASHNVSITVSPHPTTGSIASVHFNKTSQPSTQVSPNASSFTSFTNIMVTNSLSSRAVLATAFTSQSVSTFSAPGQTSKTSRLPSSVVTLPSPTVSQSTQVGTSTLAQSFSKKTVSVMTYLVGSLTVSTSNSSSTSSPPVNTTSAASPATPTTAQPTAPTLPPGGTKVVNMEVSFDIVFTEEYRDTGSPEYEELKNNLTTSLVKVYKNVDGFVGVRILFITEGSVVCNYIVILAKDSKVKESELKEKLQQASNAGEVVKVKSIKVKEDDSEETEEKLPKWALVVMIVLGCLSAVFLVTVIYVCVKYRRSIYGNNEAYLVSTGEIGLVHTYDTVSIGDNKTGANQRTAQKPAAERRVIGSHTNPAYGSNVALAD